MKILMLLCLTLILGAQSPFAPFPPSVNRYIATANTTALTVQQPATGANQVLLEIASVYCASASTITPSWNGTAATTTTLALIKAVGTQAAPLSTAWSASNVGNGTTGVVYNVPAAGERDFLLTDIILGTNGTASNYTLKTSNSCTISIQYREQ